MLIVGLKRGHDGSIAILDNGRLVASIEAEKDSRPRHSMLQLDTLVRFPGAIDRRPDIIAIGGWHELRPSGVASLGAGYFGTDRQRPVHSRLLGFDVAVFESSHERSHIMTAIGMGPDEPSDRFAVLVWEGDIGAFYVTTATGVVLTHLPVLTHPGAKYAFLFALSDPTYPDRRRYPRLEDAGTLEAIS